MAWTKPVLLNEPYHSVWAEWHGLCASSRRNANGEAPCAARETGDARVGSTAPRPSAPGDAVQRGDGKAVVKSLLTVTLLKSSVVGAGFGDNVDG